MKHAVRNAVRRDGRLVAQLAKNPVQCASLIGTLHYALRELDLVAKHHPHLLQKFGGHAYAAGLTIQEQHFEEFSATFEEIALSLLTPADLERVIESDGSLETPAMNLNLAKALAEQVWGQGFPQPAFQETFAVESQRVVGEKHLRLKLGKTGQVFDGILFFHSEPLPDRINAIYRLDVNEYNGAQNLQLMIEYWEEAREGYEVNRASA